VDALGHRVVLHNSISCLRRRGRHVQVGLVADGPEPAIPMSKVIAHELEIYGSHGMQAHRYPAMLAMIAAGTLKPQSMITRRIGLDEAPAALMEMGRFAGSGITMIRL
jgi:alcohol dehydrogenase